MEVLRNMWRRKFRTLLTVLGISIGIFAFTVMGSMALKLNKMIDGGKRYITGQITVVPKGTNFVVGTSSSTLPVDTLNKIAAIEGVEAVAAMVNLPLEDPDPDNPTAGGFSIGPPPTISGYDLNSTFKNRNWDELAMREGRMIEKGDGEDKVALGISIATDKKAKVGQKLKIRGREFEVIGIVDKTLTGPDTYVFMSLKPARELLIESNPFLKSLKQQADQAASISETALAKLPPATRDQLTQAKAFKVEDISTMAGVSWKEGADPYVLSERLKDQFRDEILVLSPKKMGEEIDKASAIFNSVVLGSAIIALIVGGFSIINTMIMSIAERTKEIGIKKAIGASRWSIAKDYTLEAGVIGLIGGTLGMILGLLMIKIINGKTAAKGAEIFLIDRNFLIGVVIFSFLLGIVAGVLPAWRASRLKIVDAIREL